MVKKSDQPPPLSFSNISKVLIHLENAGFKVSKTKIYRDCEKGMIRVNADGSVLESEVRAYASNLKRAAGDIGDLSDLQSRKTQKEIEKLNEQIAKAKFERKKLEGKYIPRVDFESELAARAAGFDSGFRHIFQARGRDLISLVGGKSDLIGDFLAELNNILNEQLTTYANVKTYHVLFTDEE